MFLIKAHIAGARGTRHKPAIRYLPWERSGRKFPRMAALRPNAPSQDFMRVIGVVSIRYKSIHDTTRRQAARRGPLACMWLSAADSDDRSEEHTSELQSLMRISYAVFCLKKKNNTQMKYI